MIENNLEILTKEWFSNVNNGRTNKYILLLEYQNNENIANRIQRVFKDTELKYNENIIINNIQHMNQKLNMENIQTKNIVIAIPHFENALPLFRNRLMDNKIFLYLSKEEGVFFYEKIEDYINCRENFKIDSFDSRLRNLIYKRDPYEFIITSSPDEILNFLKVMIEKRMRIWIERPILSTSHFFSVLLVGTSYQFETFFEDLVGDVFMLKDEILISRLGAIIYRTALLSAEVSVTKIGRYYNEKIGSKSKVFYKDHPRIKEISYSLSSKQFKAYDLRVDESSKGVRQEIAFKLIQLNLNELDLFTISLLTGLDEKEVKKLK